MKVLGIGEIILDKIYLLDGYPEEGSKTVPSRIEHSFGGPVTSAMVLLARLGADCTFITSLGPDKFGASIRKKFRKERIKLISTLQESTKSNLILINQQTGSRTIVRDNIVHKPIENIPSEVIKQADIIIMDRHEPKAFEEVVKAKRKDVQIILDPSTEVSDKTLKMFENVNNLILPIESLRLLGQDESIDDSVKKLYSKFKKNVIITAGEYGSIIYDGKTLELVPAYDVDAVDTLGAGDVFRGAFAWGVLQNWSLRKTVNYANMVAAFECTRVGNGSAIPTKEEISAFQKSAITKKLTLESIRKEVLTHVNA